MGPAEPGAPGQPRPDTPLGAVDRETLDRSLVRGVAWTGSIKWIAQVASWAATLMVARILTPDDYGLVGMAAVYFGFLMLISEAGLGMTVIALRQIGGEQLREMHTYAALMMRHRFRHRHGGAEEEAKTNAAFVPDGADFDDRVILHATEERHDRRIGEVDVVDPRALLVQDLSGLERNRSQGRPDDRAFVIR